MIKVEKICRNVKDDGHRCNKRFRGKTTAGSHAKCEECRYTRGPTASYKEQAGLVRSTNVYAKAGNDTKMRDFIYKLMATHEDDKRTIAGLKKAIDSLGNRLTYLEKNAEQATENLKLGKDIEKLKRQNKVNEKKIESMRKLIHNMKKARGI